MTFDPYEQWLQIAADRRPPSYYDLLGLPEFEGDFERIHQAGIERMAYVRRFQLGQHAAAAIQLLGELARAFDGLSTPERKAAYDQRLRGSPRSATPGPVEDLASEPGAEKPDRGGPSVRPGAGGPQGAVPNVSSARSKARVPRVKSRAPVDSRLLWAGAGIGLGLLLVASSIIAVSAYSSSSAPSSEPADSPAPARFVRLAEQTIDEGQTLELPLSIESAAPLDGAASEGPRWKFSLGAGAPPGARIDQDSGVFSWTPGKDQGPGLYRIVLAAKRAGEGDLRTELHVSVRKVNSPPRLEAIEDSTIDEERAFALTIEASDPDLPPNRLTFSLAPGAPGGMRLDPETGRLSWTPNESQGPGTYLIGVRVSDDASPPAVAEQNFSISVREVNRPPVLGPIEDMTVNLYDFAALPLKATDPDLPKNKLAFSLEGAPPADAKIDVDSQTFVWRPPAEFYGKKQKISIRVTDDAAKPLEDRSSFEIEVGRVATNSIGMQLVYIQPGEYSMGWEKPPDNQQSAAHRVAIEKPFYLGRYEVTMDQFDQFAISDDYETEPARDSQRGRFLDSEGIDYESAPAADWRSHRAKQPGNYPVANITWNDAERFCTWLGGYEGRAYRLPSEAEWEYCCRAGTTTAYSTGDDDRSLADAANIADVSYFRQFRNAPSEMPFLKDSDEAPLWNDGYAFTAPVGQFLPNAFGLHDMHGNVCEWCKDGFGGGKIVRGGSFVSSPAGVRSSQRYWHVPSLRREDIGFRVVADGPGPISQKPLR